MSSTRSKQTYRFLQNDINLMENVVAEKRYAVLPDFTMFHSRRIHAKPKHEVLYHWLVPTRTRRGSGAYWHRLSYWYHRGGSAVLPTKQRIFVRTTTNPHIQHQKNYLSQITAYLINSSQDKSTEKETFCVGNNGDVLVPRSSF